MPIKIPADLPACAALESENIFVMTEDRAVQQDIRPLEIAIVNLMPTKIATETQLLRLLSNSPLQVNITLLRTEAHESKNTPAQHLERFYKTFAEIRHGSFDGMGRGIAFFRVFSLEAPRILKYTGWPTRRRTMSGIRQGAPRAVAQAVYRLVRANSLCNGPAGLRQRRAAPPFL